MKKTIYVINSKKFPCLFNYLLVNQNHFSVQRIIPKISDFEEIVIDITGAELLKLRELLERNSINMNKYKFLSAANLTPKKIIKDIDDILNNQEHCPVCKRITGEPLQTHYMHEKDNPMFMEETYTCATCSRLSSSSIHKIMDSSKPTETQYECVMAERGLLFTLYE